MGTRSLTILEDEQHHEIAVIYRQMDGYPTGHGAELKRLLHEMCMVNGITAGDTRKIANGAHCLAAQIVSHFKTEVGRIYLHPPGTRDCGEEWRYTIWPDGEHVRLRVQACNPWRPLFDGLISGFDPETVESSQYNEEGADER